MKIKLFSAFVIIGLAIIGCQNKTHNQTNTVHDHDHGEVKALITGYSDNLELFAEADPFIVGKPSEILVHLTKLNNFKPIEKGKVSVSLLVGAKGIRKSVLEPERAGIYRLSLLPQAEGSAILIVDVENEDFQEKIEVKGLQVFADEHDAIHTAEEETIHNSLAITFTKEQSWKVDFATEHPALEPFGQTIKTTAQIQPAQGDEIVVAAKTSGVILISDQGLLDGKSVNAGQLLLTISGSGMAENSWNVRFAEAKNNFEKTKADYDRLSELAKDKIVSEKELLAAKIEYENAKALFENINENFNPQGQRVLSPINGYAKQLFVQNGQHVEIGQPLVSISQNRSLLLSADVQQKYAPLLGAIASANIKTIHDRKVYSLTELNGSVVSYGKSVNPDNYLVPVILQIDNKGVFVPGSFVELYLKIISNNSALTLPNSALLEEHGHFFVFVQLTPELFEKTEVQIGATDGFRTEILKGIDRNDRIVTKGAMLVKLAQSSAALDPHSGHVH